MRTRNCNAAWAAQCASKNGVVTCILSVRRLELERRDGDKPRLSLAPHAASGNRLLAGGAITSSTYRAGEFAALSGVSVRTLHHYDQIGLLRPSGRTRSGHRLYTEKDLLHLQQILALRYLGFSLEQIGRLLTRPDYDVVASLRAQRDVLQERIDQLQDMGATLERLLCLLEVNGTWDPSLVARATQDASKALAQGGSKMDNEQMMKRFEELGQQLRPGEREEIESGWSELIAEVEANLHLDPASPEAGALAERWNALRSELFAAYNDRGFGDLLEAVGEKYRNNAYTDNPHAPSPAVREFISKAIAAHS